MTRELWDMPGPARFVAGAVDDMMDTGCLLVELPERLRAGFAAAFENEVRERDLCELRRLDAASTPDTSPGEAIARHGLPPGVSPGMNAARDLARHPELENEALWIDGLDHSRWRDWDVFLRAFARERAGSPLGTPYAIALSLPPGLAGERANASLRPWQGELRRADTALFTAEAMIGRPPSAVPPRILETTIIELAGWNLDLARRMARLDTERLLDPLPWLEANADQAPSAPQELWDGHRFTCSLALAARGDTGTLRGRLWRAHLASVFPLLEEIRIDAAARHAEPLSAELPSITPWDETVDRPEDLELGHMLHLLRRRLAQDRVDFLHACKRMRDNLAHRNPVDRRDLKRVCRDGAPAHNP